MTTLVETSEEDPIMAVAHTMHVLYFVQIVELAIAQVWKEIVFDWLALLGSCKFVAHIYRHGAYQNLEKSS